MRDDLVQIAGAGDMLYGLSKQGKTYVLVLPVDSAEDAEWVKIADQPVVKYLPPKKKSDAKDQ